MTDEEIIEIRDSLLPSQGEQFDQLAFGRAVAAAVRKTCEVACSQALEYARCAEREACAKVCDDADDNTHPEDLAARLRMRSNVELTGGALAPSSDRRERG